MGGWGSRPPDWRQAPAPDTNAERTWSGARQDASSRLLRLCGFNWVFFGFVTRTNTHLLGVCAVSATQTMQKMGACHPFCHSPQKATKPLKLGIRTAVACGASGSSATRLYPAWCTWLYFFPSFRGLPSMPMKRFSVSSEKQLTLPSGFISSPSIFAMIANCASDKAIPWLSPSE